MAVPGSPKDEQNPPCDFKALSHVWCTQLPLHSVGENQSRGQTQSL